MPKTLKIYSAFRTGNGLVPAIILTALTDKAIEGELGESIGFSEIAGAANDRRENVVAALNQLASTGKVSPSDTGDWNDYDSFTLAGVSFDLLPVQRALNLKDSPEQRGWDTAVVNDFPFRATVTIDVEDREKRRCFLNVWLVDDQGDKLRHDIKAMEFEDRTAAWSYWRDWVAYLGYPRPVAKWAERLTADRTYIDEFGEEREVVYVDGPLWTALGMEIADTRAKDPLGLTEPAPTVEQQLDEHESGKDRVLAIDNRDYVRAWQGHSLPARLREDGPDSDTGDDAEEPVE